MRYYVRLKITAPGTKHYIQVGLYYELPFHPNHQDELWVWGYPCKITGIDYDLDCFNEGNSNFINIWALAIDCLPSIKPTMTDKDIHTILRNTWIEMQQMAKHGGDKIELDDCYMDPEREYEEFFK